MQTTSIVWRRLDTPGHDSARLIEIATGAVIEGTSVFSESGRPARLDYRIICDAHWRTVSARAIGWLDGTSVEIEIAVDDQLNWKINGRRCPEVQGCLDVDLSFTPATNLLAIRRLDLEIGEKAVVRSAWLDFPDIRFAVLEQTYERIANAQYAYESHGGDFTAVLTANSYGFVTDYPGLWRVEGAQPR